MTTYKLCILLGKVLSRHVLSNLYHTGLLNTKRSGNRDVFIKTNAVHRELKTKIERVKLQSEKTIDSLQKGIDIIEAL